MAEIVLEGIQSTVDVGEKTVVGLGVADIGEAMQRFDLYDYVTFITMLLLSVLVGSYFGFVKTSENTQDYLMGGRNMKILPVAVSLLASFISGISLLGIPTEIYVYGIQYMYILMGMCLMAVVFQYVYLPVFHNLNLTSTYEYHERRFDKRVRLFGSILFTFGIITWLPLVIYVPALAFNQVTGVNVHYTTPAVCIICIFYTSMGGLKAVVWTDVIQTIIMFGAMILVVVKGTLDAGGLTNVWQRNWDSDRIEGPNFDLDPSSRHTVWSLVIGGFFYFLQTAAVNQNMVQRYLSLSSIRAATISLWLFICGMIITVAICSYAGMVIYAMYHKCDPLTTMLAKEKDQLLPLLVMETIGDYPGLPGIFVAGIFSAALSSLSTGLNSMAAVVIEDFYKPFATKPLTEKQSYHLMKLTVLTVGAVCVGLVVIVEKLGTVLQLTMSLGAIASGPSLGIFTMGILLPWANATGALTGGVSGLIFMSWLCLRAQAAIASGDLTFPEKSVTTEGCHYHFVPKQSSALLDIHFDPTLNATDITHTDERFMLYRLSYLWYCMIGAFVTIAIGLIVSFCTTPNNPQDVDPCLIAPLVRKLIKPRKYPNQPLDTIIYAYGNDSVSIITLNLIIDNY
ncbi:hypothetical protein HHI36_006507 [Cryptolaemus montrouzieri]|uniref:Sodium-coupled monocarboxylate transporter 1 n=1 Tax=Cryptolaemus montrouzieri TaxID=559131 RepID=A0ABD2NY48_9CUCU